MGYLNLPPNLKEMFDKLHSRLDKLEMSQRFTAPKITADPTSPRNGDLWLNSTTNTLKVNDSSGITQNINLTPVGFTPVLSTAAGTITSYVAAAQYIQVGKLCVLNFQISITNNGTGAGNVSMSLPFTVNGSLSSVGAFRENAVVGTMGQIYTTPSATTAGLLFYNNAYPAATGYVLLGTLSYITV